MAKAQAHFRLDPDLLEAMKARAEAEKITVTDLVARFLEQGLGLDTQSDIQNVDQKAIEESVYQRISERVTNQFTELENRILERIAISVSELNKDWEERTSERIAKSKINNTKIPNTQDIERIPEENITANSNDSNPERISDDVPSVYTEKLEETQPKDETLILFDTTLNELTVKPAKLANLLNEKTNSKDWDGYKLRGIRMKQLTWIKNYNTPGKKSKKDSPLPKIIGNYIIDWVISSNESDTAMGKEWWIKKLPDTQSEIEALIEERVNKYIHHYYKDDV